MNKKIFVTLVILLFIIFGSIFIFQNYDDSVRHSEWGELYNVGENQCGRLKDHYLSNKTQMSILKEISGKYIFASTNFLKKIDADGRLEEIGDCTEMMNISLSPDKSKLVYKVRSHPYKIADIILYDLKTQVRKKVAEINDGEWINEEIIWSPDSQKIVFNTWMNLDNGEQSSTLYLVDLITEKQEEIFSQSGRYKEEYLASNLQWLPNNYIIYRQDDGCEDMLYQINANDYLEGPKVIGNFEREGWRFNEYAISPDGNQIAIYFIPDITHKRYSDGAVRVCPSSSARSLDKPVLVELYEFPSFKTIFFKEYRLNYKKHISFSRDKDIDFFWSPDSRALAFFFLHADFPGQIITEKSAIIDIPTNQQFVDYARVYWSPNSVDFASSVCENFFKGDESFAIYDSVCSLSLFDKNGGLDKFGIIESDYRKGVSWSSDGSSFAYINKNDRHDLVTYNILTQEEETHEIPEASAAGPWISNTNKLFYYGSMEKFLEVNKLKIRKNNVAEAAIAPPPSSLFVIDLDSSKRSYIFIQSGASLFSLE